MRFIDFSVLDSFEKARRRAKSRRKFGRRREIGMAPRRKSAERASDLGYELSDRAKSLRFQALFGNPANFEVYDPTEKSRLPLAGSWGMIIRQLPPIEGQIDEHIRMGRIFFLERLPHTDSAGFLRDGTYKALCRSPWGDVHLWPYEYSIIQTVELIELWTTEEIVFHPTQIDDVRFSEIAFYARSRGIGLGDAAVMALGTLSGPVGWFEPKPELAELCEQMERHVNTVPWQGQRWPERSVQWRS